MRSKLARKLEKKVKTARDFVCRRVMKRITRQRFRKLVILVVEKMKGAVSKIQRVRRRIRMHRKVLHEVNRRVAFKL